MKPTIETYKKIKAVVDSSTYYDRYRNIYYTLFSFSFFGNILSVFFAFFLLNSIVKDAVVTNITTNPYALIVASVMVVLVLIFIEATKRELFSKFTQEFLKSKQFFKSSVLYLFISSLIIISISFGSSMKGAEIFTSKENKIEETRQNVVDSVRASIVEKYAAPIKLLQEDNNNLRETNVSLRKYISETKNIYSIKNYNTQLENNQKIIAENDLKISEYENKQKNEISNVEKEYLDIANNKIRSNNTNVFIYLLFSFFIEVIILIGVYYSEIYEYKSYLELNPKFEQLLKKEKIYKTLLNLIFKNGEVQQSGIVHSPNKLQELLSAKGINIIQKDVNNFYSEATHVGIFETKGSRRYAKVNYSDANVLLEKLINDYKSYVE